MSASPARRNLLPLVGTVVVGIALVVFPQVTQTNWVDHVTDWIPLAIAALGLNLLTGYNGQISVGHGALFGVGAYTAALSVNEWQVPFLAAVAMAGVLCFGVGVVVGLPALRIKGLYLALVTLAVATLFPQILEQFSDTTGGSTGLSITRRELNSRGVLADREVRWDPPKGSGLAADQWKYYVYVAVAVVCFVVVRNLVHSRVGRSMIAIRDNETAAEVSGVNVAAVKVFTFGVSAALAGIGGALFALSQAFISSGSVTLLLSLEILVAVVIGGTPSIAGPAIGALFSGFFKDVVTPELSKRYELGALTPIIFAVLLIVMMLTAPGGVVGVVRTVSARVRSRTDAAPST